MATKNYLMSQLVFKFPFKTKYYEQDYYVSSNNFSAYRLIESWPNWPDKCVNIFGPKGSGKTHLSNIFITVWGNREAGGGMKIFAFITYIIFRYFRWWVNYGNRIR